MSYAINTFIPDNDFALDRAKRNTGGLGSSDTLIEQGDSPVNIVDLEGRDKMDLEMRAEFPEMFDNDSNYVQPKRCEGDIHEGVSMCRPMYKDTIRKNSDY